MGHQIVEVIIENGQLKHYFVKKRLLKNIFKS